MSGEEIWTFVVPDDPADRPRHRRRAVRLVVLDESGDRVFLLEDRDLGTDPVAHFWNTPGGGVDPGESDVDAAVRELREETGVSVSPADLVGPLAVRRVVHGFSDTIIDQDEVYFAVIVGDFELDRSGWTALEQQTMTQARWFALAEIPLLTQPIYPQNLLEVAGLVDRPSLWAEGPVELPESEESTVPV